MSLTTPFPRLAALAATLFAVSWAPARAQDAPAPAPAPPPEQPADTGIEGRVKALERRLNASEPGSSNFLLTGYGFATYDQFQGDNRTFNAGFSPIFLWHVNDRIFFSAELEVGIDRDTHNADIGLEFANAGLIISDRAVAEFGKILTPLSNFQEHYEPAWINKCVDKPMYATDEDRLVPTNSLGLQVRGGVPVGNATVRYAVWAENGPELNTSDPTTAGTLQWEDQPAGGSNNNATVGAHLWLSPIPNLEFGAAWMGGRPGARNAGYDDVKFSLTEGDLSYQLDADAIKGVLDARGEYVRVTVTNASYAGLADYDNRRSGGYGQLAYRAAKAESNFLRNLEPVIRYDWLTRPDGDPTGFTQKRWTAGLNYYLASNAIIKAAWERRKSEDPAGAVSTPGFVAMLAIGF